jgi:elongation factor 1-gamma
MASAYSTSVHDGNAIKVAAKLAGLEITVNDVKTVHKQSIANRSPVLESASGSVWGLSAVLRSIARGSTTGLYGQNNAESDQVDQWVDFIASLSCVSEWLTPIIKQKPQEASVSKNLKAQTNGALKVLNTTLNSSTFLVGHQPTIADIIAFSTLFPAFELVFSPPMLRSHVNVVRWFDTLLHTPPFSEVWTEHNRCVKEAFAPRPEKKEEKVVKKEEKQVAAVVEPPKPKNPLLALPESKMIMDSVKKLFFNDVNAKFNPTFWEEFWPQYDAEGYSFWTADHKYDDENEQFWLTQNLVGGWIQRLDPVRKFAFGAAYLSGKDEETKPWKFQCIFLFRGLGIPAEVTDNDMSNIFDWTKVDTNTEAGKAVCAARFTGDQVEGLNILDRRYFK